MKKLIWIIVAVALVACSKKSDDATKGSAAGGGGGGGEVPSCGVAAAKAVASLGPGADASGMKEKLQAIYATRCSEDKWPAEVIKCYESAAGMPGLTACRGKLPVDLGTKLRNEIMATMAGAAGSMGGRPPMGHPGGAAAGSAGAPAAGGSAAAGGGGEAAGAGAGSAKK